MALFALALDLPERFFDDKFDRHISHFRIRNHPTAATPPLPHQLRAGAHADYGSLTILRAAHTPGGLQVLNRLGAWVYVPIAPGRFIVAIAELMSRWTNGHWKATLHRVVNPPPEQADISRRLSLVYFHNPNYDAEIAALPGTVPPNEAAARPPTTMSGW